MNDSVIPISYWQLAFTTLLLLATGAVSAGLQLGLLRQLIWGTVRTFVQLTLIGYVLTYVFKLNNFWIVCGALVVMALTATHTIAGRAKGGRSYPAGLTFLSLATSTMAVGFIVTRLIISPEPWYSARVSIPILGMLMGNSMNGIGLCLERIYEEAKLRRPEIEELLSFGATPWESVRGCVRSAIGTAMKPSINSLMVVGIVSLPGMMTGQILAGADPREAVRYQIVVMLMITAAVAIGCLMIAGLSYKRLFDSDGALIQEEQPRKENGR